MISIVWTVICAIFGLWLIIAVWRFFFPSNPEGQ